MLEESINSFSFPLHDVGAEGSGPRTVKKLFPILFPKRKRVRKKGSCKSGSLTGEYLTSFKSHVPLRRLPSLQHSQPQNPGTGSHEFVSNVSSIIFGRVSSTSSWAFFQQPSYHDHSIKEDVKDWTIDVITDALTRAEECAKRGLN